MKQKYSLYLSSILFIALFFAVTQRGISQSLAGVRINQVRTTNFLTNPIPKDAVEDVSKRTPNNSIWRTKDGKIICCTSSEQINYSDATGALKPVNIQLKSDAKGWVAAEQQNPCYFRSDRSTAISLGGGQEFVFNRNSAINGMTFDQQITKIESQKVSLDLSEGVHKNIRFLTNGIKTNYVFDKPLDGGISVSEEVQFPEGCTFTKDVTRGEDWFGGWNGDYVVLSAAGDELARLWAPVCYDANHSMCSGYYKLEKKDGKYILTTAIPSGWLATAKYPVTLDPKITGPTTKHHGGSVGSCLYPAYSADTLLSVMIPGKITITDLNINYAYTTNDSGVGIPLNNGRFYFSTTCGNDPSSGYFSCDSSYAGVCYLVSPNDLHVPLTCCYDPSCSNQFFNLVVHLARTVGSGGCNNLHWVYYDATDTAGIFTYKAYVSGYTDSVSSLIYTPTSQCSNSCSLLMNAQIQFGVPPYTVKHPWAARDTVISFTDAYRSCTSGGTAIMKLTIPNCPYNCLTDSNSATITVPPPTVIDACGDTVKNIPSQTVILKPVPVVTANPMDSIVCSGNAVTVSLNSCIAGTTYSWTGSDNASGSGNFISDNTRDTGTSSMIVTYKISGSYNGCNSDTVTTKGKIEPLPNVTIVRTADTIILGTSETITATGGITYSWMPATGLSCTSCPNPVVSPTVTTTYSLVVTDTGGCQEQLVFTVYVRDENIIIPNVITPNDAGNSGLNSLFYITNLNYYANSKLTVFDRWGKQIYTNSNYQNNWDGGGQSDGVYYYLLTLPTGKKYQGFYQLIK